MDDNGRDVNEPINREGRSPEYRSENTCPACGRRLVYFAADRLHYCRACAQEYTWQELQAK